MQFLDESSVAPANTVLALLKGKVLSGPMSKLRDAGVAYLEHILTPGIDDPAAFDIWRTKSKGLLKEIREIADTISAETLTQELPWLKQIAATDFRPLLPRVYQATAVSMLESATTMSQAVNADDFGRRVLRLLRDLTSRIDTSHSEDFVRSLAHARRQLEDLPRGNVYGDAFISSLSDEPRELLNGVKYLADIYEHRGKEIVEFLWKALYHIGWLHSLNVPDTAHIEIEKKIKLHLPTHTLILPRGHWRHWRNAADHKGGLELLFAKGKYTIRILDKNRKGVISYNKEFTAEEVLRETLLAAALLEYSGAYKSALDILMLEKTFDALDETMLDRALASILGRLR